MAKPKSKYDILTAAALAVLAISGCIALYVSAQNLKDTLLLGKASPSTDLPPVPIERVRMALANLTKEADWQSPVREGKPVPLLKSIIVVQKNGEPFDLYKSEPKLREPMTNEFLIKHNLNFLAPNVGELDPDDDGFSNLEEFNSNTDPTNKKSHPPLTDHLFLVQRVQDDYILALFGNTPPYSVRRIKPANARAVLINTLPYDFGFEPGSAPRFRALKFEPKSAVDPKTQLPVDVSEMTVLDTSSNEEFVLVSKQEKNLAAFQAKLEFRHGVVQNITVKKGENFRIAGIGSTFKLIDVQPDSAKIIETTEGMPAKNLLIKNRPQ